MASSLDKLLRHPGIWQAERDQATPYGSLPTGFVDLDQVLPGGGWPLGSLTEIIAAAVGIGELRLVLPALSRLSKEGRWIAWIAPPYIPYAPALAARGVELSRLLLVRTDTTADALWAAEQVLRSGSCGAVLAWPTEVDQRSLRRLQLAVETGRCWGLLFPPPTHDRQPSPAALRLKLEPSPRGVTVQIFKCRGRGPSAPLVIDLSDSALAGRLSS